MCVAPSSSPPPPASLGAQVYGVHNEARHSVQRQKQGTFTIAADSAGEYRVCFSNRMSTMTSKVVSFSLRTGDELFMDIAKKGACATNHSCREREMGAGRKL